MSITGSDHPSKCMGWPGSEWEHLRECYQHHQSTLLRLPCRIRTQEAPDRPPRGFDRQQPIHWTAATGPPTCCTWSGLPQSVLCSESWCICVTAVNLSDRCNQKILEDVLMTFHVSILLYRGQEGIGAPRHPPMKLRCWSCVACLWRLHTSCTCNNYH